MVGICDLCDCITDGDGNTICESCYDKNKDKLDRLEKKGGIKK